MRAARVSIFFILCAAVSIGPLTLGAQESTIHAFRARSIRGEEVGLDRYRVLAMKKMLDTGLSTLEKRSATRAEMLRRAEIYITGCRKHGRLTEAADFEKELNL